RTGTIPKTSSGKIRRRACRDFYLSGGLEVVSHAVLDPAIGQRSKAPAREELLGLGVVERRVVMEWRARQLASGVLGVGVSEVVPGRGLTSLGLDSLGAVELQWSLESEFGVSPSLGVLLGGAGVGGVVEELLGRLETREESRPSPRSGPECLEYGLSEGQRGLWLAERLSPESSAYTISVAAQVSGDLDVPALERALRSLASRHDALRTTFIERGGEVAQRLSGEGGIGFGVQSALEWSERKLSARLLESVERPFDLERGPLARLEIWVRGEREHVLALSVHHLVADLWSLSVLVRELGVLYEQSRGLGSVRLEAPLLRCSDYVTWQGELLGGIEGERLWEYWRARLADRPGCSELSADRPRPAVPSLSGDVRTSRLGVELSSGLRSVASDWGTSLFVVGLSGLVALIHRYSGQEDLAVGSPAAGRTSAELEGLVGYLVNPLVLRADLSGTPSFRELVGRTHETVLGALEHQDYPFAWLAQRLVGVRDPSRSPLFQLLFTLPRSPDPVQEGLGAFAVEASGGGLRLGSLALESVALAPRSSQFDLSLRLAPLGEDLAASAQYSTELFEGSTIERFLGHFRELLRGALEHPQVPIGELAWLTLAERDQVLRGWNETSVERPEEVCLHELFFAQAARTPERLALVAGDQELRYGEMAWRVRQLASRLVRLGVGAEVRVGVLVERSADLLVTLLGVLASGGVYVGLDPLYPPERLGFMAAGAGMRLGLVGEGLADRLPPLEEGTTVLGLPALELLGAEAEPAGAAPGNLAYLIYTSGS